MNTEFIKINLKLINKLKNLCDAELFKYLSFFLDDFVAINTKENYARDIFSFLEFIKDFFKICKIDLNLLDRLSITEFRSWLLKLQQDKIGVSSRSRMTSAVKSFHKFLIKNKKINNNSIFVLKMPRKPKLVPRFLQEEEINKFVDVLYNDEKDIDEWISLRDFAIINLLYGSGLRISEALGIKIKDINFNEKQINILGKGGKFRIASMLDVSGEILWRYIKICPYMNKNNNNDSHVFFSKNGKKLQRTAFAAILTRIKRKYNLPDRLSAHSLRHSFATHLFNKDVDIRYIQEFLGHVNLKSTEIYTKVSNRKIFNTYSKSHPRFDINDENFD